MPTGEMLIRVADLDEMQAAIRQRDERIRDLEKGLADCVREINEILTGTARPSWSAPPARRLLGRLGTGGE